MMSKEEIKDRFKQTKLGKKIFKRFKLTLIFFIVVHILMLISLVLFVPNVSGIISGAGGLGIVYGIVLMICAILSFVFSMLLIFYDGKIVGCIELFDLMLRAKAKVKEK